MSSPDRDDRIATPLTISLSVIIAFGFCALIALAFAPSSGGTYLTRIQSIQQGCDHWTATLDNAHTLRPMVRVPPQFLEITTNAYANNKALHVTTKPGAGWGICQALPTIQHIRHIEASP